MTYILKKKLYEYKFIRDDTIPKTIRIYLLHTADELRTIAYVHAYRSTYTYIKFSIIKKVINIYFP